MYPFKEDLSRLQSITPPVVPLLPAESFTAACRWDMVADAERRRELVTPTSPGVGVGANGTPPFRNYVSYRREGAGTTAGGQFGWGGTPLKRYRGGPKVGSSGTETRCRV